MLKTLKLFLLTITFALLGAFSAFAGEDSCGHLDFLNETGVSGWCYQNSQPSSPADFTLRIANVLTGETVQEIPATTSLSRPDLATHSPTTSPEQTGRAGFWRASPLSRTWEISALPDTAPAEAAAPVGAGAPAPAPSPPPAAL